MAIGKFLKEEEKTGYSADLGFNPEAAAPKVTAFIESSKSFPTPPKQALLPDRPGLSSLVDFYKEELLLRVVECQTKILSGNDDHDDLLMLSPACALLSSYAASYSAVLTWKNTASIDNVFSSGQAGLHAHAALRGALTDKGTCYAAKPDSKGWDLKALVDRVKKEQQKKAHRRALLALADLPPEEMARAVELLKKDNGSSPPEDTTAQKAPRQKPC